jgi:glycosyltransferase involved in cell wall biosynthesis
MKTIGIVVNSYTLSGVNTGGHAHIFNMARCLDGVRIVFFGPERARHEFLDAVPGAAFVAMPDFPWLPGRLNLLLRGIFGIFKRRELRRADALLTWSHFIADALPAIAANGARTVVAIHHFVGRPWERHGGALNNWLAWLAQEFSLVFVRRYAARFVFVSPHVMRQAAATIGNRPAFLTKNGVAPPPGFVPAPFARRSGAIYLGRVQRMKRVKDAIVAWSKLPDAIRMQRLRIVGTDEGAYEAELRDAARDLGLSDTVEFAGRVDETTKWKLLGESSLFVFPSAEEGWGIAIAEAMAAGLPCVTYDLPVYRDIFVRGRVEVSLGDVDALANACRELLVDDARRERLGRDAAELAATFSWKASADVLARALTFE